MSSISNLGYFVLGVSDLDAWETFAVEAIGMQAGRRVPGKSLALRMDDYVQRILLEAGSQDDVTAVGWEFDTESGLDAFVSRLRESKREVVEGSPELAANRCVERVLHCVDPSGVRHEFYVGAKRAPMSDAFRSKVLSGPFSTGRLGVGHYVSAASDEGAQTAFCKEVLGLKLSDYIRGEIAPGVPLNLTFFHANTGRHHSIATARMPFPYPKRAQHLMVEVAEMNDVGLAYDRCVKAGYAIEMGLGHHPNDQMFSFYVRTPSGFHLEVGAGGIVVEDAHWEVKTFTQLSDWGHHRAGAKDAAPA